MTDYIIADVILIVIMIAIFSIKPGTSASVNLKKELVTVSRETPVDDRAIVAAIETNGYKVV